MVSPVCRKRPFWVPPPKKFSPSWRTSFCVVPLPVMVRASDSSKTTSPSLFRTVSLPVAFSKDRVTVPSVTMTASSVSSTLAFGWAYLPELSGWAWIFAT